MILVGRNGFNAQLTYSSIAHIKENAVGYKNKCMTNPIFIQLCRYSREFFIYYQQLSTGKLTTKSRSFGLGQTKWAVIWGIFGQVMSAHFGNVFYHLTIMSTKKTNPLCLHYLGLGFEF